ncbi:MAG: ATP-binding protein [Bacilli bacterium]|nr:ATP-binding protein [Bacilli bacterium]
MIERKEYMNFLLKLKDKHIIKVVTGIRRCGKSTLFELYKDYLLKNGVKKEQIISLNFENPNDMKFNDWKELFVSIESRLLENKMNYIFLDEVQILKNFEKAVDGLYIKENVDIYITGSNSYMLSGELATYLTGRYMQIHMLPLSFLEYLEYYGLDNEERKYHTYIKNGGFPYLLNLDNDEELIRNYLDGVYHTVLLKDVVSRNNIKDTMILDSIIKFLFDNIGQLVSTNKIANTLASNHRKCSVNTVESYLNALIESYIIYKISRYDIKGKEYLKTGDKYYVCDLGLRNYLLGSVKDLGSILENIIFLELKRRNYDIYIGKYEDSEVDFVVKKNDGLKYIQVSLSVRDEKTLEGELTPLKEIHDNYPKYIITLDYDSADYEGIRQINAIDLLMGRVDL